MNRKTQAGIIVVLIVILSGCLGQTPAISPIASPLPTAIFESPVVKPTAVVVPFQLDKPIVGGTSSITGSGSPGVPVAIFDITFMGEVLGTGKIGADGRFTVNVSPLESGHMIGLALGELAGTSWNPDDFAGAEYRGEGATQIPQVGFFYDTTTVTK